MKKKITNKELLKEYEKGLSDIKIAKKFSCAASTIQKRRYKLNLVANFDNWMGKKLNKKECGIANKKILQKRKEDLKKKYLTDKSFRKKEFKREKERKLGKLRNFFIQWLKRGVEDNSIIRLKKEDKFFANCDSVIIDKDYFLKLKERMGELGR